MKIRVLIVDDNQIVRQGLKAILGSVDSFEVVGEAENGCHALDIADKCTPTVVLMDIKMPVMDGVEATRLFADRFPDTKVVILTTFTDDQLIIESLKNGASGYLLKDDEPGKIIEGVLAAATGGAVIQPQIARRLIDHLQTLEDPLFSKTKPISGLSHREQEICLLVGQGKTNSEIAEELFITLGTVKNHISSILGKLELRDRTQLAILAVTNRAAKP